MSHDTVTGDLGSGQITFIDKVTSALLDGEYEVVVGQRVRSTGSVAAAFDELFVNRHRMRVEGPRFSIGADAVRTVFPPPDSRGEYASVLPHVVLERLTLPWERSAASSGDNDDVPWLAVLLLDDDDPGSPPPPSSGASPWRAITATPAAFMREYLEAHRPGTISYPNFALGAWEAADEPCQMIDIPTALWTSTAPLYEDLPWLAHARRVLGAGRASESVSANTELSVVIGNRMPHPNQRCTAHLVSLEGMKDLLPRRDGPSPSTAGTSQVRLISLKSWSFVSVDPTETFAEYLLHLDVDTLAVPFEPAATDATPSIAAETLVQQAFARGYTAFDHRTADGQRSVSWYRGPLVPTVEAAPDAPIQMGQPVHRAGELVRLDPASGLADTSYAAAWQLGQLLGLRDAGFSKALYQWKHANTLAAAAALEHAVLRERLGKFLDLSDETVGDAAPAEPALAFQPRDAAAAFRALGRDRESWASIDAIGPIPTAVTEWLAATRELAGVPFNYLVAEPAMLPPESLRFFALDPHWMTALIDGAFSIGRSMSAIAGHDAVVHEQIHGSGRRSEPDRASTGFLLRSGVVSGWPHLRVLARDAADLTLEILVMVHLAGSMLLVLVDGIVASVDISEPPEGLHFGVRRQSDGACCKPVRAIGSVAAGTAPVDVAWRAPAINRVVDIGTLAARLRATHSSESFTAAEFALQMVEGVEAVRFGRPSR